MRRLPHALGIAWKRSWKDLILFAIPFLCALGCLIWLEGFGSSTDWYTQHIAIADDFRSFFYRTHRLFPDFMSDLGSGQNVFSFAYYGLYRYDVLLSYLFPFLSMSLILPIIHLSALGSSAILLHHFLKRHVAAATAFFGALCLLLAAPMFYHSAKQVIFVLYMPFVILGFYGADRLLQKQKYDLYLFAITMMILTSFYFTVGGALACFAYLMMSWDPHQLSAKKLWKSLILLHSGAVLVSAFFWMPCAYALFTSGAKTSAAFSLPALLTPDIKMEALLYSPYCMGVGLLMGFCLFLWAGKYKSREGIAAIVMLGILFLPICLYLMNLGLYARPKALIPLLPFLILLTCKWLDRHESLSAKQTLCLLLIGALIVYQKNMLWAFWDFVIAFVILWANGNRKQKGYYAYLLIMAIILVQANQGEPRISYARIKELAAKKAWIASLDLAHTPFTKIADYHENAQSMNLSMAPLGKTSIYSSIHAQSYNHFYYDVMRNNLSLRNRVSTLENGNPFFLAFSSSRYLISENKPPYGYVPIAEKGALTLYENKNVLPFAYGSDQVISQTQFASLSDIDKIAQLLLTPVVSADKDMIETTQIQPTKETWNLQEISRQGKWISAKQNTLHINSRQKETMRLSLQDPLQDEILIMTMQIKPIHSNYNDLDVTINGIRNRLSGSGATYPNHHTQFTFYTHQSDQLEITFSSGNYQLSDIRTYRLPTALFQTMWQNKTAVTDETYDETNAVYEAKITMQKDGWLITSLPLQDGYTIWIDGRKVPVETVNLSFVGCQIDKGTHRVKIHFQPPLKVPAQILSLTALGVLLFAKWRRIRYEKSTNS
ncbi:MAG TPA: YfhO family protein [Candidatus Onthosoma merdavium]|nr:YfhO family protein [Candidatus Onthosoma merdavium]